MEVGLRDLSISQGVFLIVLKGVFLCHQSVFIYSFSKKFKKTFRHELRNEKLLLSCI